MGENNTLSRGCPLTTQMRTSPPRASGKVQPMGWALGRWGRLGHAGWAGFGGGRRRRRNPCAMQSTPGWVHAAPPRASRWGLAGLVGLAPHRRPAPLISLPAPVHRAHTAPHASCCECRDRGPVEPRGPGKLERGAARGVSVLSGLRRRGQQRPDRGGSAVHRGEVER